MKNNENVMFNEININKDIRFIETQNALVLDIAIENLEILKVLNLEKDFNKDIICTLNSTEKPLKVVSRFKSNDSNIELNFINKFLKFMGINKTIEKIEDKTWIVNVGDREALILKPYGGISNVKTLIEDKIKYIYITGDIQLSAHDLLINKAKKTRDPKIIISPLRKNFPYISNIVQKRHYPSQQERDRLRTMPKITC